MKFLKYILPTILLTLMSYHTNAANYFISGSVNYEDRLALDYDVNDLSLKVKAIFSQNAGQAEVDRVLILVEVVAMGATDTLELRLNPAAFNTGGVVLIHKEGGTCSGGGFTEHDDCLNNGHTWTPNVIKYNGAGEVYPTSAAWNTFTYPWGGVQANYDILVMSASDMFESSCAKTTLVNTEGAVDCASKTIAITLEDMGLTWGDSQTNDLDTDCVGVGCEINNQLDLAKLFKVRNLTTQRDILAGGAGNFVFHTPVNIGYPRERVHWFDAFVGLDQQGFPSPSGDEGYSSSLGSTVKVKFCDPRDAYTAGPTQAECEEGLADWFGGGLNAATLGGGITAGKLNTNNTQDYDSRTVVETRAITTADFDIHQICGSGGGEPIFGGCIPNWDPKKSGGNLHLITQYYSENAHGHSGLGSRERRDLCLISDACASGGGSPSPPAGGGRLAPIVSARPQTGSVALDIVSLLHEATGNFGYNLIPKATGNSFFSYFWIYDTKSTSGTCPDTSTLTQNDLSSSCTDATLTSEYDCINAGICENSNLAVNAAQHNYSSNCTEAGTCSDNSQNNEYSCLAAGTCTDPQYTYQYACVNAGFCSVAGFSYPYDCENNGGGTWTTTETWTPTNTWTSHGNTWTPAGNTWNSVELLQSKQELILSALGDQYFTFAYTHDGSGNPEVISSNGNITLNNASSNPGSETRTVPGANFLIAAAGWSSPPYADVTYHTGNASNGFFSTAPCASNANQPTCDAFQQCQWNNSSLTCDHVYLSGFGQEPNHLTNTISESSNYCVYNFITENNQNTWDGGVATHAVASDPSTTVKVTKFKINSSVTAIPLASQNDANYCVDNNLGKTLDEYGFQPFLQCLKVYTTGANSYNDGVSNDSIPAQLE
jgi:hypothetical protein